MIRRILRATAGVLALAAGGAAAAQTGDVPPVPAQAPDAAPVAPPATRGGADEIVVTARKRQESILRVPVVETALTAQTLQRFAINDLTGVTQRVPGLLVGNSTGAFGNQISLRGIGTNTLNAAVDQSVSLVLDGLPLTQGLSYRVGFFDIAQVEVLRGPQALFYGKASPAGVVAITTADPGREAELLARATYEFEGRETREDVVVSGPVSDTLGIRIAGQYTDGDGYFRNVAVANSGTAAFGAVSPRFRRLPDTREWIVRGTMLWKPTDRFTARLKANYDDLREQGIGIQIASCPDGTGPVTGSGPAPGRAFLAGDDCKLNRNYNFVDFNPAAFGDAGLTNNGVAYRLIRQHFGTADLAYELLDDITLTSVTGYYKVNQQGLQNSQATTMIAPTNVADTRFSRRDLTQELRLTSSFSGSPINFLVGGFYQDGLLKFRNNSVGNLTLGQAPVVIRGNHRVGIKSLSGFGQLIWNITPRLELAGGLRYTYEKRDATMVNRRTGVPVPVLLRVPGDPNAADVTANPTLKSNRWTPEASLTFRPTDDLTLFASYKQAAKSGSFNTSNIVANGTDTSFGDELVKGGEAGIKGRLLDRQVTFNLAGYYYRYTGLQVGANEVTPQGAIIVRTLNAASADTYGMDFDASYRPAALPALNLYGAVSWNHARYDKFDDAQCWGGQTIALGCNRLLNPATGRFTAQDLSGHRLVRAPEWAFNLGFDYDLALGGGKRLTISSNTQYTSRYLTSLLDRADMYQKGYWKTDLNLTLHGPRDAWELAAVGKNLTNKIVTNNCTNAAFASSGLVGSVSGTNAPGAAGSDELACFAERGRELWLRLTIRPLLFRR